jgi:mRNA-degrading endonuclease HigB of HigAB toxin-antitoxin module
MDKVKEEDFEKIAVSYRINKKTKKKLDDLKKYHKITATEIIDDLCVFDIHSCNKFIHIINLLHNKDEKENFIALENGGIVLNKQTTLKISKMNLNVTNEEFYENEIDKMVKKVEKEELEKAENSKEIITQKDKITLNSRMHSIEVLYVKNRERIEKLEKELKEAREKLNLLSK